MYLFQDIILVYFSHNVNIYIYVCISMFNYLKYLKIRYICVTYVVKENSLVPVIVTYAQMYTKRSSCHALLAHAANDIAI